MEKILNRIEAAITNELSEVEQSIFRLYFTNRKNYTTEQIGKSRKLPHKLSKQRVSFIIQKLVLRIPESDPVLSQMLDTLFLSVEYRYFDSSYYKQYDTFMGKVAKDIYNYHSIGKGLYTTNPDFKYYTQQKYLSILMKTEGLPLEFWEEGNGFGNIVWFGMRSSVDKDEWLILGNKIVGSSRFTFCTNCCRYQVAGPVSLWDIYAVYLKHFKDYLAGYEVETPKKLCLFIQRRMNNLSKIGSGCEINIVYQAKESSLGFPIYEMSGVSSTPKEILKKATLVNDSI